MKYRWILGAVALVGWTSLTVAAQPEAGGPSVLVTLTAMRHGSLPRTIEAYGVVQAPATASRTVAAPTSETVAAVYVREGQEVAAGTPLLQLTPSPETAAAYVQARSALHVAEDLVTRTKQMFAQHLATAQQLADARKSALDAKANLTAQEAQGSGGPTVLRASYRAIVLHVTVAEGARAAAGAPLLDLARPEHLVLRIGLVPSEAKLIQQGAVARVTAVGEHQSWPGAVLQRGAMIDPATGLVPIEISVPPDRLLSGEAAEATIIVGEVHGYVVPHAAVLVDDSGGPYVVQADGMKARRVPVSIAGTQGDEDVIQGSGLNTSQSLVLSGNYQLDDGMAIRVAPQSGKTAK